MAPRDVDAGLRLCRLSRWNQVARDWDRFLEADAHGAAVAVAADGRVVGSVATMRYGAHSPSSAVPQARAVRGGNVVRPDSWGDSAPTVAWVAMVLVDPHARGQGIGTALLREGLARVADATAVGLDATPLGQPIYEKLGFRADATFTRMARPADSTPSPARTAPDAAVAVRRMAGADLDAVAALDTRATGLDRRSMLAWLRDGAPECAWVAVRDGSIAGFGLGRRGHDFDQVGPVVAESSAVAEHLLQVFVEHDGTRPLIVDVADAHAGWRDATERAGFTMQRPFTRMYRGVWRPQGTASLLFAIIGPEFG